MTYRDAILHCAPKNHNLLFGLTSCFAIRERQSFVKKKPRQILFDTLIGDRQIVGSAVSKNDVSYTQDPLDTIGTF